MSWVSWVSWAAATCKLTSATAKRPAIDRNMAIPLGWIGASGWNRARVAHSFGEAGKSVKRLARRRRGKPAKVDVKVRGLTPT